MDRKRNRKLPTTIRFWTKVKVTSKCWNWIGLKNAKGYGLFHWSTEGLYYSKRAQAHRASWLLFKGPIPSGLFVLHKCDNRSCVRPDHLWLGTVQDNQRDMVIKGRAKTCGKYNRITGLKQTHNKETLKWRQQHIGGKIYD